MLLRHALAKLLESLHPARLLRPAARARLSAAARHPFSSVCTAGQCAARGPGPCLQDRRILGVGGEVAQRAERVDEDSLVLLLPASSHGGEVLSARGRKRGRRIRPSQLG
eukprot:5897523-Prymnesium_polylepis.1